MAPYCGLPSQLLLMKGHDMDDFIRILLEAGMTMTDIAKHAYEYAQALYEEGKIQQKYGRADILYRIAVLMKGQTRYA